MVRGRGGGGMPQDTPDSKGKFLEGKKSCDTKYIILFL